MLEQKIAFIGSGAMGEAIIAGLLRQQIASPNNLLVSDPRAERVQELHEKYGVQPFTDNICSALPLPSPRKYEYYHLRGRLLEGDKF